MEDRLPVVRVAERPVIASRYRTGAAKTASTGVMGMAHAKVSRHKHMHAHAEHKDEYEYEEAKQQHSRVRLPSISERRRSSWN